MQKIIKIYIVLMSAFSLISIGILPVNAAHVEEVECFIDQDPGEGNGISLACIDGACDEELEEAERTISLNNLNLKIGYHIIYCRAKNDSGMWSMPRPIVNDLWITKPNLEITGEMHVAAAECFFDTDPGPGNGIPCFCRDGACDEQKEEVECKDIEVSGLLDGNHRLYCRTKDSQDSWGVSRSFSIQTYDTPYLALGEYFIDNDPGLGNGIPIQPTDGIWDDAEEIIDRSIDASSYASEEHHMFVRMQDSYGRWGLSKCYPFGKNPCEGDFDSDQDVDGSDLAVFAADFGRTDCNVCSGDFDRDGDVDGTDLAVFAADFGRTDCFVCP